MMIMAHDDGKNTGHHENQITVTRLSTNRDWPGTAYLCVTTAFRDARTQSHIDKSTFFLNHVINLQRIVSPQTTRMNAKKNQKLSSPSDADPSG